ncbi:MAG: signal peptidase I [Salinivirgaceae bacterium]|jgi:signal peptidase I|nr:signal peptidase I [Salinivirgaceae bacterium]
MTVKNKYKELKGWGRALLLALIFGLLIKGLVLESFIMMSSKMEKTILKGDYIFVEKISNGARLPITPFSLPFFPKVYNDVVQFLAYRIPGIKSISSNDLLVFNNPDRADLPIDKKEVLLKRCIGVPGDTIQLTDKKVFVNHKLFSEPDNLQFNFRLVTNETELDQPFLDKYSINEGGKVSDIGIYEFPVEIKLLKELREENNLRYVRDLKDFPGESSRDVFPKTKNFTYTKDFFGSVEVPRKGQILNLSLQNFDLYKTLISRHEGNSIKIQDGDIYINEIKTSEYKVKFNYYFVLDDNRDNANDSRYWGFLPENHIIGKASLIWFSYDKKNGMVRWDRCFNKI